VCPNEIKRKYLSNNIIHNYKFYNLQEIKEKIFFKYDDLALYNVVKKYDVKPAIALKMLENLYYINDKYEDNKLKTLYELKEELLNENLIIENENFLNLLNDEIVIEGYPKTKELDKIIALLSKYTNVTYKTLEPKYELKEIYEFESIDSEIEFVAENILELIANKIDINKIFIINYNREYLSAIVRIFTLFNIPYSLTTRKPVTMFNITKKFLKFIKDSDLKIRELNEFILTLKGMSDDILNQIVNVLNKYYSLNDPVKDLYPIIYFELKNTFLKEEKYINCVNIISNIQSFDDDYYVFLISGNEQVLYKDNDYLKDDLKKVLNLNTSNELNRIIDNNNLNILKTIKNLKLSYKLNSNGNEYNINPLFENLERRKYEFKHNSLKYNQYLFENQANFDNHYTKIDYEDLKAYIGDNFHISYSSMDQFFKCKFRFYLNNILKIEPNEDKMSTKVGNMFHKILERTLKNNYENYLEIINEESINYLNSNMKEQFYAEKLKKEAIKIIERLQETDKRTDFKNAYYENYLEYDLNSKLQIKLIGYIDKILLFDDGNSIYFIVIDYKTGSYSVDLSEIKDGFNMQLLVYLYLITKTDFIKNSKIAGAYIDHILDELKPSSFGKNYDEIIDNRLEGLSINDKRILNHIDNYYDINSYIKGIKVKKDGEFYSNSKVYSEKTFNKFLNIIEENIKEVVNSIDSCDFSINPKRYYGTKPNEIIGCEFCPFKEVCYMTAADIKMLKKHELDEIIGDQNEVDE